MKIFGSLVATLAVLLNFIDCFRVQQLPPFGQLPGHPDYTFFTVSPEDFRDVYVQVNDGLFIPVQEPLLVVSKNDYIIGWMDHSTLCPIYNEDRQEITISMENGRSHVMDIDDRCLRERSRTPPNYIRNRRDRSETSSNHNSITQDRLTASLNYKTPIPDFPRSPPNNMTSMQNRLNIAPIYDTIMRDRSTTPPNQGTAHEDYPRNPPGGVTFENHRSETALDHNTFIRYRSRSPLGQDEAIQGQPETLSNEIKPHLNDATCHHNRSEISTNRETDDLDFVRKQTNYRNVIRERSRSPRKHATYQTS